MFYLKANASKITARERLTHYVLIGVMSVFMLWSTYKSVLEAIEEPNS